MTRAGTGSMFATNGIITGQSRSDPGWARARSPPTRLACFGEILCSWVAILAAVGVFDDNTGTISLPLLVRHRTRADWSHRLRRYLLSERDLNPRPLPAEGERTAGLCYLRNRSQRRLVLLDRLPIPVRRANRRLVFSGPREIATSPSPWSSQSPAWPSPGRNPLQNPNRSKQRPSPSSSSVPHRNSLTQVIPRPLSFRQARATLDDA